MFVGGFTIAICCRISPAIDQVSFLPNLGSNKQQSSLPPPASSQSSAPTLDADGNINYADYDDIMPGTRRLDMDITEYEYVDTNPR